MVWISAGKMDGRQLATPGGPPDGSGCSPAVMALVVMRAALSAPCRQEGKSLASDLRIAAEFMALMSIVMQGRIAAASHPHYLLTERRGHCRSRAAAPFRGAE